MNDHGSHGSDLPIRQAGDGNPGQWIDPAQPVYALVDPIAGDVGPLAAISWGTEEADELIRSRDAAWHRSTWLVQTPRAAQLRPCAQPYLVMLTGIDDPWFDYLVELAQSELQQASTPAESGVGAHACGGFLQSGASAEALAHHLSGLFRLAPGTCPGASYLRLADRRTLSLVSHAVGPKQLARALGPISQWVYLGVLGQWRRVCPDSPTQPLSFSPGQWGQMELGATIHPPISRLIGEPSQIAAMRTGDESSVIASALEAARRALDWQPARHCGALTEGDARDLVFRLLKYSGVQPFEQTLSMVTELALANSALRLQAHLFALDEQMTAQAVHTE